MTQPRQPPDFDHAASLVEQLGTLLDDLRIEAARRTEALDRRIVALEADTQELQQMLLTSERQSAQLANLYVATFQLHASLELEQVRNAICEIAVNLLGAERYALLLRDDERGCIDIVARGGALEPPFDGERYERGDALVDTGLVDGVVRLGPAAGSSALAVVPLSVQGTTLGALVIVAMLPHKVGLAVDDRELLDVLAAHAASALLAARLFHERGRKLRTLEGLMGLLRPTAPQGGQ